jgi:hypothetical protein
MAKRDTTQRLSTFADHAHKPEAVEDGLPKARTSKRIDAPREKVVLR